MNEVIEVGPSSKKQMTNENGSFSRLAANASPISIHPSPPASKAQDVESIPFHRLGEKVTISGDDFTASAHTLLTAPIDVPSREELDVLLERFPIFTNMEPITSHIN